MKDRLKLSIFLFFITFSLCIEDYYKLLGVSRKATQPEIRRAFKKLALKYHPDKTKDKSDNARDKFAKIANAYETLNDQEKRKEYDDELDGKINFNKFGGQGGGDHRRHHSGFNSNFPLYLSAKSIFKSISFFPTFSIEVNLSSSNKVSFLDVSNSSIIF